MQCTNLAHLSPSHLHLSHLQEPRVQGLCLIDPVDNSSFGPQGVGYPSSLPSLQAAASSRQLPVLVIGAALNTDVVPPEANWRRFVAAAAAGRAPVWEVVLKGASHLQFLDKQQPLFALFSNNGPTPDEVVRQIVQVRGVRENLGHTRLGGGVCERRQHHMLGAIGSPCLLEPVWRTCGY